MDRSRIPDGRGERGIALVVALLALLVISMLVLVLMMSVNVNTKITSHGLRENQALNSAQAGIAEAMSRLSNPDDLPASLPVTNPRSVVQIFNVLPGSVPALGTDSTGYATNQPAGDWLDYSTAARDTNALTVQFLTNQAKTTIYRYDTATNPHIQTASGSPIYVITATGRLGGDRRRVQAEVIQKPVQVLAKGAVVAHVGIDFSGTANVCGRNHRIDTPVNTRIPDCDSYLAGTGDMPGAWSEGAISMGGHDVEDGNPPRLDHQSGFYTGPWDVFNLSQAAFYSWVGSPLSSEPDPPKGIIYLDNNSISQDGTGSFAYHGGDGEGFLYVDGDLTINGNFSYKGLIYVEGDLKINGNMWILGGLVVKGVATVKIANGDCTVLYSADAITQYITKYGGQMINLAWRELP
jgi:Tfp pilus assembly protein PilX